jgi:hypothetical protein
MIGATKQGTAVEMASVTIDVHFDLSARGA